MKTTRQQKMILFATILVTTLALFNVGKAFADDGQPPVEPVGTEVPVETEEPVTPDAPVDTEEPVALDEAEVQEILEQVPPEMDVIVLDENGQPEPLATQEAVEIILNSDPMWCKDGVTPDPSDPDCSPSFESMTDLMNWLFLNDPNVSGTIWIADSYDSGVNDPGANFYIMGMNMTNMANNALTLQGGWSGIVDSTAITGVSEFNGILQIDNWNGNITLSDILVDGANGNGIAVYTNGDIHLHNVSSNNNDPTFTFTGASGAVLQNSNGTGNIILTGDSTFNNNGGTGLAIVTAGSITLNNVVAINNLGRGALLLSSGDVNLFGAYIFNNNISDGLYIRSGGDVVLENITANENGDENNNHAGVYIENIGGGGDITLTGNNVFNNNLHIVHGSGIYGIGLLAYSAGEISLENITANDNGQYGVFLDNTYGDGDIMIAGVNMFDDNLMNAVNITSSGSIVINNITVSNSWLSGLVLETTGGDIEINCGAISNNGAFDTGYGLSANLPGTLTLTDVVFSDNALGSVQLINGVLQENSGVCGVSSLDGGNSHGLDNFLSSSVVFVANKEIVTFDCTAFSETTMILAGNAEVTFKCPFAGSGSISILRSDMLPDKLSDQFKYVSGLEIEKTPEGNDTALDGQVVISFIIPEGMDVADLAILYWNGSEWVDLKDATFDDGRKVINGGFNTGDGYFQAIVNFSGSFVLVTQ